MKCIHVYTVKLGAKTGIYKGIPICLILLQSMDCGYSLELPRRFHFIADKKSLYISWAGFRNTFYIDQILMHILSKRTITAVNLGVFMSMHFK